MNSQPNLQSVKITINLSDARNAVLALLEIGETGGPTDPVARSAIAVAYQLQRAIDKADAQVTINLN